MAAKFPAALATDADLLVAKNRAQTTLVGALNGSDTTFTLAADAFAVNVAITIDSEIILITAKTGATVTACTRAYDGTAAASHTNGKLVSAYIDAGHHNNLSLEVQAIETALGVAMANVPSVTYPIAINKGGTGAITQAAALTAIMGASALPVANGGTGATTQAAALTALMGAASLPIAVGGTAATTAAGARASLSAAVLGANNDITSLTALSTPLSVAQGGTGAATLTGVPIGAGTAALTVVAAASQLQFLRRKPNVTGTVYEFASGAATVSSDYDFPVQATPDNLSPSLKTVTLTPVPLGVNGTDSAHYVGIFNNAGVFQEFGLINGGSAVSGAASGTLTFAALAGTYATGAYKIGSATSGVQEAIWSIGAYGAVSIPAGAWPVYATITVPASKQIGIRGAGIVATSLNLQFAGGNGLYYDATTYALVSIGDFRFDPQVARTSGYDLHVIGATFGTVQNLYTRNTLNGYRFENCNSIQVRGLQVQTFSGNGFFLEASSGSSGGFYSHLDAIGTGTNALLIQAGAGTAFSGTTISDCNFQLATNLINLYPNGGALNEFLFSNIILDTWSVRGVWMQGGSGTGNGIAMRGFRVGTSSASGYALGMYSNWSNIVISDWTGGASGQGIVLNGAKFVQISNVNHSGDGSGVGGNVALTIDVDGATPANNIKIVSSSFGLAETGLASGATATNGISITAAAHTGIRIFGCTAYGSATAGTASLSNLATGTGNVFTNNNFVGHTSPAVASAATVTFPAEQDHFTLTGAVAVGAVAGLIQGQRGTFVATNATPGTWTAGATIGNTITPVQNVPVNWVWDGTKVFLK